MCSKIYMKVSLHLFNNLMSTGEYLAWKWKISANFHQKDLEEETAFNN